MTFEAQQCHADDPISSPSPAVETTPSRDTSYDVVDVATARHPHVDVIAGDTGESCCDLVEDCGGNALLRTMLDCLAW